ncbi:Type-2 restriction enzyme NaeI [Tsuneonella dongtanensis]|uniref:Type-2 restriction enzyme NaeI n=1 Tax=Tsuneonella dongtanensis TaxID=692370 RepID=A0A1B2AGU9_9SPHN|nr:NaeI family type II restriction endonuclease [Tsuneonella dongtanensis]ANY21338.1 Type-2 restriction enzyme NaeI [Tsuneonella dongtanensis]
MNLLTRSGREALPAHHVDFAELAKLETDLLEAAGGMEIFAEKLRSFFRSAIDEVIDTARTGRYFLSDLEKTEKTYLGTKFEILLRDWLQVPRGVLLDLLIGGKEVDVKSTTGGKSGWMIPPEAINQLCVLLRVNEVDATCAVGLIRARTEYLRSGVNRDAKTSISADGRRNIWWLALDFPYTPNFWTLIDAELREAIMAPRGGTARLATLFENCLEIPVSRVLIASIAAQDDFMKRIRRNGGARDILAPKGIAILYSEVDRDLMARLGLRFGSREFLSYRPRDDAEAAMLRAAGHID